MTYILELEQLSKSYPGGIVAVDNLSFNIPEGEFVTFLGPSGCGKTTMLRLIAGFENPDHGQVILNGENITDVPAYQRNVNTVFQDYALFPHLTIFENVAFGLKRQKLSKHEITTRTSEALEKVELLDKASQNAHMLSGGQKQRAALARAVVCNPAILLLDEPLSALDAKLREAMQVELKSLHDSLGLTFILVTHDQSEAMVMSDRVVIMNQGKIEQIDKPSDLYERPVNPYVADFIGTSNLIRSEVCDVSDNKVSVKVCNSVLAVNSPNSSKNSAYRIGDEVTLCVRPEKLVISQEASKDSGGCATIPGTLVDYYFHGSFVRFVLDFDCHRGIIVDTQLESNIKDKGIPSIGSRVYLEIRADSAILFQ